uniref:Laminin G domain-containing protein n=1 Tax=Strigamia maritima TaxID=126957 RepID=T1JIS0_STRMM
MFRSTTFHFLSLTRVNAFEKGTETACASFQPLILLRDVILGAMETSRSSARLLQRSRIVILHRLYIDRILFFYIRPISFCRYWTDILPFGEDFLNFALKDGNNRDKKAPSEATFRGNDFLSVDLVKVGSEPIVSSGDEVSLFFKTRQPNGLLFYSGDGEDFLNLALKDGGVVLTINLGSGALEKQVKPSRVRFDDNQWHKVIVHRKVLEVRIDSAFKIFWHPIGEFLYEDSSL